MTRFTFDSTTAARLMDDLNNRGYVTLTKANGASISLCERLEYDEFGDMLYNFTINSQNETSHPCRNLPINEADLLNFLTGESFVSYDCKF